MRQGLQCKSEQLLPVAFPQNTDIFSLLIRCVGWICAIFKRKPSNEYSSLQELKMLVYFLISAFQKNSALHSQHSFV